MPTTHNIKFTKDTLSFALLCMYVFMVPLGTLFRFGTKEGDLGMTTVLLVILVSIHVIKSVRLLFNKKTFFIILLLIIWLSFSTFFAPENVLAGYKNLLSLLIYVLLAGSMTQINFPAKRLKIFFLCLAAGILISSVLTLIDFAGIIDIPRANELHISTKLSEGFVMQASGFFPRRSAMAAYFALILPAFFVFFTGSRNNLFRFIMIASFILGMIALLLTHNRAGVIAILFCSGWYVLLGGRTSVKKKVKTIVVIAILLMTLISLTHRYFNDISKVYMTLFGVSSAIQGMPEYKLQRQKESDLMRVYFFSQSLNSLIENPIGNGFSQIKTERYGFTDPHNIITQIVWGAGVFSLFWLCLFGYSVIKLFMFRISIHDNLFIYYDALKYGLLSWFIIGMAHTIICTGLAWVFLGIMLNLRARISRANKVNAFYADRL